MRVSELKEMVCSIPPEWDDDRIILRVANAAKATIVDGDIVAEELVVNHVTSPLQLVVLDWIGN